MTALMLATAVVTSLNYSIAIRPDCAFDRSRKFPVLVSLKTMVHRFRDS
jgi:hypothetical protein